ncbi:Translation_initiation inhibitor [Hexamita inflata]|uniref:Translation initiation inhibitor n=1 Tax=Hexamita inflata TaxID=28002 RepID=A0AA86N6M9_9EUKA|nr:Translation initiation inhibitor [Hexamita inflata]
MGCSTNNKVETQLTEESKLQQVVTSSPCFGPYSAAIKANGFIYVSGQLGIIQGNLPATVEEQTEAALQNLKEVLDAAKSGLNKVAKCQVVLQNMDDFTKVNEVYAKYFTEHKPARICVEMSKLPKGALIEIDAIAIE